MTGFEWTAEGVGFTRDQAPHAMPNGTRIVKAKSEAGDAHVVGDGGRIVGSLQHPDDGRILYFVAWDDMPDKPVGVSDWKLRRES